MQKLKVEIFSEGSAEIEVDGKAIVSQNGLEEIAKKISRKEMEAQVFYNQNPVTLCIVQGGIGAKGEGYIVPLLGNPLANLFLALCEE